MTLSEAKIIAEKYVIDLGEVIPGFTLGVTEPKTFDQYFYFDFIILNLERKVPQELPSIGGAPGIIVERNTGKVETISFSRLFQLNEDNKTKRAGRR